MQICHDWQTPLLLTNNLKKINEKLYKYQVVTLLSPPAFVTSLNPSCLSVADRAHFTHTAASSNTPADGCQLHTYNFLPGV